MAVITDSPNRMDKITEESNAPTEGMFVWMSLITQLLQSGFSGTIVTAKLTGGGANGSMTFKNGVLISQTPAT